MLRLDLCIDTAFTCHAWLLLLAYTGLHMTCESVLPNKSGGEMPQVAASIFSTWPRMGSGCDGTSGLYHCTFLSRTTELMLTSRSS